MGLHRKTNRIVLIGIFATAALLCCVATAETADEILQATGVQGGLVVHVGCGDGRLTATLGARDSYLVHGLDSDAENVRNAREHVRSLGIYGTKVAIDRFDGRRLPYAENLVNLLVAEDLADVTAAEVTRVLSPGGVAHIKQNGQWTTRTKPRPKEIDEWTHYLHDADNNAVARDTVVGPPQRSQWIAGPRWGRSHDFLASVSAMVSAGGRIFYIVDEGPIAAVAAEPKWMLAARDAFSGVLLWKRPVGPWEGHLRGFRSGPTELARRLVAVGDKVYVTLGYGKPVTALDAATGATLRTFDETAGALEIVLHGGTLFTVVGDRTPDNTAGAAKPVNPQKIWHWWSIYEDTPPEKHLVAIRAATGDVLWKKDDADTVELMPTT
ncbi:MAG: methyltransferase domain-containing protein, partial [Candidatus Nealsonbacteria bacterium]|nr:methyltransferase domain-containing protein [Candidatus Nealsonbacteria bacterium]